MPIEIEEFTRQGLIPLIGVYGASGTGKTHSAMLLARGLAGPDAVIGIVDTERRRSGALEGLIPGPCKRINLEAPFTPESYIEAIEAAEAAHWAVCVIDSMTHEWDGEGGVLEMQEAELQRMAGTDYSKREACKMAAWIQPKQRHKKLVKYILRAKIPVICCLRGQEKTHIEKGEKGEKTKVFTDVFTSPIYDSRFIFEMLVNIETIQVKGKPGCAYPTKWTHNDLLKCLPGEGEQISIGSGEAIARWCADTGKPAAPVTRKHSKALVALKTELWTVTEAIHHGDPARLQQWLVDELIIGDDMQAAELTEAQLPAVISKARAKLKK